MSEHAKSQGAQCWICPQCFDDEHHEPGDNHCLMGQKNKAMAIARLNQMENRKLREQLATAQAENEALRARVAELRELVSLFGKLPFNCHDYMTEKQWEKICWIHAEIDDDTSQPWLLRKQAEALDNEAKEWREDGCTDQVAEDIAESAQRLRQQADELEAGAGGEL